MKSDLPNGDKDLYAKYRLEPLQTNLALRLDGPMLWLRRFSSLVIDELRPAFQLSWRNRLRAWRWGYTTKSYVMYDLGRNDPREYVSEFVQKVKTPRFNGTFNALINNKLSFSLLMDRCGAPHPHVFAVIQRGTIHLLEKMDSVPTSTWLQRQLDAERRLVIKPITGFKGRGFIVLSKTESAYLINGVEASFECIERLIATLDDCIISSFVHQAGYAEKLFPETTNTIRLLTYWDRSQNQPFIAAAAHRIGTSRSFPVDNWKSGLGGMSSQIDIESGVMSPALNIAPDGKILRRDSHPETGSQIVGVRVPGWESFKEEVLGLARILKFIPDIAWDCVVTDDGFSILELNGASALFVFQVHSPLLRDPRVKRFYETHDVL